ncbi:MAG: hypothetical protein WDL87_01875 [Candidatus Omnitrophota bacterium]|jgi:hypothetical protein
MNFEEIKAAVKSGGLNTLRGENEEYLEGVIVKNNLDLFLQKLNEIFGAPAWPSTSELSAKTKEIIDSRGGLMKGQTMFLLEQDGTAIFVMLWPWQDGIHITIKLAKQ